MRRHEKLLTECSKCDEGKPDCQRCVKRGEQCPGYQRPKFRFVGSETGNSKGSSHPSTDASSKRQASRYIDPSLSPQPIVIPPSPSISRNWSEEAIPWYFRYYTIVNTESAEMSWFEFVPRMYTMSRDETPLRLSVQAASLAGFANYLRATRLAAEAQQVYGAALIALNAALRDNALAQEDETLAAALTLVIFEASVQHPACTNDL